MHMLVVLANANSLPHFKYRKMASVPAGVFFFLEK